MASNSWKTVVLGNLIDIKHGYAFKGEFFRDTLPGDILLTPGNFAIGGGFKSDKFKYYLGEVPEAFVLTQGDLLVTMTDLSKTGDTLGYPALVPKSPKNSRFLHNQRLGRVLILPGSSVQKDFLYYLLCTKSYKNEILASATGTTVKHTSPDRIKAFRFSLPPLPEQKAIAHILGALDDKIELNQQMNRNLEAIAQAIFKSWFVDFDPVRAKMEGRQPAGMDAATAALFPDSFEDSQLGEIPKGWKTGCLGDIADNPRSGVQPENLPLETPYIGLEHMPRRSIALADWGDAEEVASNKFSFCQGDILFGKLRPYFHKVGVAVTDGVCSTDIVVIVAKLPAWYSLVLSYVSSIEFINYTNATSTGTRMPRTNWNDMARYEILMPTREVAKVFDDQVLPLIHTIRSNILQSRTLATIRNTLLPKLMSGEIQVKEAEKILEDVA